VFALQDYVSHRLSKAHLQALRLLEHLRQIEEIVIQVEYKWSTQVLNPRPPVWVFGIDNK